ncbi:sugar transferase [Paucilactobacillus suebicus]|uniref:Beta-1,6-galactofuranosyltransferase n=1 Tax=Paucilactobacillus suebicus DSM 5007 = KCTC 3549 TaxID=1423807 RepID=A0A0R1VW26_9LACO|nr:sugar transferase [Paucilactobacillus suebicus]KRM09934.1 beta-1,6-galactofuranosyltransferase [Paucilactobacillus suebicus DSM 5007 = KCTC 3549]
MTKWVTKIIQPHTVDAVFKAKDDITTIAQSVGYDNMSIFRYAVDSDTDKMLNARLDGIVAGVDDGDIILYQYPNYLGERFDTDFVDHAHLMGAKVFIFAHDSEHIRGAEWDGYDEVEFFNNTDGIIAHNKAMRDKLIESGVAVPIINNYMFDYLYYGKNRWEDPKAEFEKELVFAGSLGKSDFLTNWDHQTKLAAFGRDEQKNLSPNVDYRGEFQQEELIKHLPYRFGLAWDTNLKDGGTYGEYTRFNNPHKVSMYLSQALPVVVWDEAGIAPFIVNNDLGIAISSLDNIDEELAKLSEERVAQLRRNAANMSKLLRQGYFTKRAILKMEELAEFGDITY